MLVFVVEQLVHEAVLVLFCLAASQRNKDLGVVAGGGAVR